LEVIVITLHGSVRRNKNVNISMTRLREKIAAKIDYAFRKSKREKEREREKRCGISTRSRRKFPIGWNCEFREGNFVTETKQRTLPFKEFPHSRTEDTSSGHDYRALLGVRWIASRIRTFCLDAWHFDDAWDSPIRQEIFGDGRDDRRRVARQIERKLT